MKCDNRNNFRALKGDVGVRVKNKERHLVDPNSGKVSLKQANVGFLKRPSPDLGYLGYS